MSSYWIFRNEIDKSTCKRIMNLGKKRWISALLTSYLQNDDIRKSKTAFTSEQWLYDIVFGYMHTANENSGWNFQVDAAEDMQITKYNVGGHYDYHEDGNGITKIHAPGNEFLHGKTRKLSMSIILNDDFEGGQLEFMNNPNPIEDKLGTIVVFPSYMQHRVKPVTSGTRYSLVAWFVGESFR